jgi:hypothetical protein
MHNITYHALPIGNAQFIEKAELHLKNSEIYVMVQNGIFIVSSVNLRIISKTIWHFFIWY